MKPPRKIIVSAPSKRYAAYCGVRLVHIPSTLLQMKYDGNFQNENMRKSGADEFLLPDRRLYIVPIL